MGAKDWMLFYADGEVRPILQAAPEIDRDATRELVQRLYPRAVLTATDDGNLFDHSNPRKGEVYAGCFPGLSIVCSTDVALDQPSELGPTFRAESRGRTLYLHAMHSTVDWFAYAIWSPEGELVRSLSLSPDSGVIENVGSPRPFEAPYWAGERAVEIDEDDDEYPLDEYPLPFHPLELAEDALRALFGFNYEGEYYDGDPDLDSVVLAGFRLD